MKFLFSEPYTLKIFQILLMRFFFFIKRNGHCLWERSYTFWSLLLLYLLYWFVQCVWLVCMIKSQSTVTFAPSSIGDVYCSEQFYSYYYYHHHCCCCVVVWDIGALSPLGSGSRDEYMNTLSKVVTWQAQLSSLYFAFFLFFPLFKFFFFTWRFCLTRMHKRRKIAIPGYVCTRYTRISGLQQ